MVPEGKVTLIYGDGGTGKSQLALQLAAARALGLDWLGVKTKPGKTLFFSAEDDEKEMHRRLAPICRAAGVCFSDLGAMRIRDNVGQDAVLGAKDASGGIRATELFDRLSRYVSEWRPDVVIIDTLASTFAGNELDRAQAQLFIGLLNRLCARHRCTVIVLAHPSLSGMATGSGTSGSTGWNNAVRSRLYFQTVKTKDGREPNPSLRELSAPKANYGRPMDAPITLKWERGVFELVVGATDVEKLAADAEDEALFLMLLKRLASQSRPVSDRRGANFAPVVFADEPDAGGVSNARFRGAMTRLFATGAIKVLEEGPPSRRRRVIVTAEKQAEKG
jgi:RecA-family ATPase